MCGIAGFLHFDASRPASAEAVKRMTDSIVRRGPDGEGFVVRGNLALGNRRLAIIDLEAGAQPMSDPQRGTVITFNGEIYNYLELRTELEGLGHRFRTESDTEVLLRAYEQWDLDMLGRLNGMWAFALWDERERRLFVARDRLGEKPVYHATHDGTFVFGSEAKCLIAYGLPRVANRSLTEVYLALGYVPAPYSYFAGIDKLEPGHFLLVEAGRVEKRRYWVLPARDERDMLRDRRAVNEEFAALLEDSVRLRMRSDVPFGAFLSGGLDSSSIVALMSGLSPLPTETFTIGFSEPSYDERRLARMVAERFGTEHHEHELTPESCDQALGAVLDSYDEPFGDTSAIATGAVSAQARRSVKMVLTGDGGDEAMSGYNAYQTEKLLPLYQRLPRAVRALPPRVLGLAARRTRGATRFRLARLQRLAASSAASFDERLLKKSMRVGLDVVRAVCPAEPGEFLPVDEYLRDRLAACPYTDGFYRMMYFNLEVSLPEDMLTKVDRMSMAHSLEVRVPFLDHRLVEFLCGVHKDLKMRRLQRKSVLRDTVGKKLPRELLHAGKRGFGVPLYAWFEQGDFAERARSLAGDDSVGFDRDVVRGLLQEDRGGDRDHGAFLWMLLVLDGWFRR